MAKASRARGEGSIFKLKDGRYRCQVRYRDASGQRHTLTKSARTKLEAREALAALREKAAKGLGPLSDQTLAEYLDEWHEQRVAKGLIRSRTAEMERRNVRRISSVIGAEKLEDLDRAHVYRLLDALDAGELAGKVRTIQQIRGTLSRALKAAVARGRLQYNPAADLDHSALTGAAKPSRRFFTPEELRAILKAVDEPRQGDTVPDHQFATLVHVLAHSGLRVGEALALRWQDVDYAASSIHVRGTLVEGHGVPYRGAPKTATALRTVRLPAAILERLKAHRRQQGKTRSLEGLVFTSQHGRSLRISNLIRRRWHLVLDELGIARCGFHSLRHSHASMLIARAGVDPVTVAERLGHADPGITLRIYAHPDEARSIAAADAFARAIEAGDEAAATGSDQ